MRRIVLGLLLVVPVILSSACKRGAEDEGDRTGGGEPGAPGDPGSGPGAGGPGGGGPGGAGGDDLKKNPIEGIAPAKVLLETGAFTDGPVWHAGEKVVFFSTPLGEGGLYRVREDGSAMKVRDGNRALGEVPIGNTIDKAGNLLTVEAKRIMRGGQTPEAAPAPLATGYEGDEAGAGAPFDTLNDAVVMANGTMFVTDPGYFGEPIANRIYRVAPDGRVTVLDAFEDVPRPNGIALSPDQSVLYVGFTQPIQGTKPFIRKYYVKADGSLGEHSKLVELEPDAAPDGIEVDQGGNIYVATKTGLAVFKSTGEKIGLVPVPEQPTGMAFGGKDMKTLFITTQGSKMFVVTVNVPGIAQ